MWFNFVLFGIIGTGCYLFRRKIGKVITHLIITSIDLSYIRNEGSTLLNQILSDAETQEKLTTLLTNTLEDQRTINSFSKSLTLVMNGAEFRDDSLKLLLWYMTHGETDREIRSALIKIISQPETHQALSNLLTSQLEDDIVFETAKAQLIRIISSPTLQTRLSEALYSALIGSVTPRWFRSDKMEMTTEQKERVISGMAEEATEIATNQILDQYLNKNEGSE